MRFLPALAGALAITVAFFLFMQGLIQRGRDEGVQLVLHENVRVLRPQPEERPETKETPLEEPPEEPLMEALDLPAAPPAPPAPVPATEPELPTLDAGLGDIQVAAGGQRWRAPLAGGTIALDGTGQDARGYIEVVPYDTRRPNVPEAAWRNKIDGWVLVAFSVTPQGKTRDVRVLDARPRGVFEEKVVAAVEDWTYRLSFSGRLAGDVVLTQKVEVHWKNYLANLPNVD